MIHKEKYAMAWHLYSYNNPLVLVSSIGLFNFFKDLKLNKRIFISGLGKYTLYVYIIHSTIVIGEVYIEFYKFLISKGLRIEISLCIILILIYTICLLIGLAIEKIFSFFLNKDKIRIKEEL